MVIEIPSITAGSSPDCIKSKSIKKIEILYEGETPPEDSDDALYIYLKNPETEE